MNPQPLIRELFGRFQNLNLSVLREDLRRGEAIRGDWVSSGHLCPLAHGLSAGQVVRELRCVSQSVNLEEACRTAAKHLGARPIDIYRFVRLWDDSAECGAQWLREQLDELWSERLADADCVQRIVTGGPSEPILLTLWQCGEYPTQMTQTFPRICHAKAQATAEDY